MALSLTSKVSTFLDYLCVPIMVICCYILRNVKSHHLISVANAFHVHHKKNMLFMCLFISHLFIWYLICYFFHTFFSYSSKEVFVVADVLSDHMC